MTTIKLPVSFAALYPLANALTAQLLDPTFASELNPADRQAITSAIDRFAATILRARDIEPHGYNPFPTETSDLATNIVSMFSVAYTSVAALGAGTCSTADHERLVGGILSMARDLPRLDAQIEEAMSIASRKSALGGLLNHSRSAIPGDTQPKGARVVEEPTRRTRPIAVNPTLSTSPGPKTIEPNPMPKRRGRPPKNLADASHFTMPLAKTKTRVRDVPDPTTTTGAPASASTAANAVAGFQGANRPKGKGKGK